jgi:hypothetical protein
VRRGLARGLIVVLTVWALALFLGDFGRLFHRLASPGFYADNDGLIYDVRGGFDDETHSPAWQAGIRAGDRIDLWRMRCAPLGGDACATLLAVLGGIEYVEPGRVLRLSLLANERHEIWEVELTAIQPPPNWLMRGVLLLNEIAGLLVVLAAAWLVWTRPSRMSWGFFLFTIWFNPGQGYTAYAVLGTWPAALLGELVLEGVARGTAYAGLLLFVIRAPADRTEPRWRLLERALPLVALGFGVMQLATLAAVFGHGTERISSLNYLAGFLVDVAALAILLSRLRAQSLQDRQRLRWVIAGCVIGLPAHLIAEVFQYTTLWNSLPLVRLLPADLISMLYLVNGVLTWFVFEAVRRPRVLDVWVPLRRISLIGLLVGAPFGYLHAQLSHVDEVVTLPHWAVFTLVGLLLFTLNRLQDALARLADRSFNRTWHREAKAFDALGAEMLRAGSAAEIDRLLVERPAQILRLASAALFREDGAGWARQEPAIGWDAATTRLDPARDAGLLGAVGAGKPVRIPYAAHAYPRLPGDVAAPALAVPISDRLRCFALVLYGAHRTGTDLAPDERALVARLAEDAAAAYARAELESLRAQLKSLQDAGKISASV